MNKQLCMKRIYDKISSQFLPIRARLLTCFYYDVMHFFLANGITTLHTPPQRVRGTWRVLVENDIYRDKKQLNGITNPLRRIQNILDVSARFKRIHSDRCRHWRQGSNRSPVWRARLLDARSCNNTHPTVRGSHQSFASKIPLVVWLFQGTL